MKVRMKVDVSGNRNGVPWPARGEVADLPKDEAVQLCQNGMADPVDGRSDGLEKAVPTDDSEQRGGPVTTESASATVPGGKQDDAATKSPAGGRAPAKKAAPSKPADK